MGQKIKLILLKEIYKEPWHKYMRKFPLLNEYHKYKLYTLNLQVSDIIPSTYRYKFEFIPKTNINE